MDFTITVKTNYTKSCVDCVCVCVPISHITFKYTHKQYDFSSYVNLGFDTISYKLVPIVNTTKQYLVNQ